MLAAKFSQMLRIGLDCDEYCLGLSSFIGVFFKRFERQIRVKVDVELTLWGLVPRNSARRALDERAR